MEWQPIETAPHDRAIQLWFEDIPGWLPGPWRGSWSWNNNGWSLHLPFMQDEKVVVVDVNQKPTHWQPFQTPPETL